MPIVTAGGGTIRNSTEPNRRMRDDLNDAVTLVDFTGLFRGPGTIAEYGKVRIDVQGQWSGPGGRRIGANIQAQVGGATIAAVRVADTLGTTRDPDEQAEVVRQVVAALVASTDGTWREVTGTPGLAVDGTADQQPAGLV